MGTEAAFLVDLQHEFLSDAAGRVTECLDSTADITLDNPEPLRFVWTAVHTLKGEAGVVGFPHLLAFLSDVEDSFTMLESKIAEVGGTKNLAKEACARLASAVREVFFSLEDYVRSLTRDYSDRPELFATANETCLRLREWSVEASMDWGMGENPTLNNLQVEQITSDPSANAPKGDEVASNATITLQTKSDSVSVEKVSEQSENNEISPAIKQNDDLESEIMELDGFGKGYNFDVAVFSAFKRGETLPVTGSAASTKSFASSGNGQSNTNAQNGNTASTASHQTGAASTQAGKVKAAGNAKFDPAVPKLYLMVNQDGGMFALPLINVVEIVQYRKWNALPVRQKKILGVLNLRGAVLPIFDLHEVLGAAHLAKSSREERILRLKECKCIVVVQVEGKSFGFVVEMVSHVTEMRQDQLFSADRAGMGMVSSLVAQMGLVDGKTVLFLDVKGLVA